MNLLKEQILANAKTINEDVTAPQLGNKLVQFINDKNMSLEDMVKRVDNFCHKDWVRTTVDDKRKLITVSINPLHWEAGNGVGIIDAVIGDNNGYADAIKKIMNEWTAKVLSGIKAKYPKYQVQTYSRKEQAVAG